MAGYVATGYTHAKKEWTGPGEPTLKDALKSAIKLGLDLRGGIHLVLQVNTADALKAERDDAVETLKNQTKDAAIGAVELPTDTSFTIAVTAQTDKTKLEEAVKRFLPDWNYSTGGGKWTFVLKDPARRQMEDNAVSQAVETIRNRVDEFGVAEPLIAREGTDRILVQLPGIDDPKRVKDLIKNTAFLELSLVENGPSSEAAAEVGLSRRHDPAAAQAGRGQGRGGRPRADLLRRAQAGRDHRTRPEERAPDAGPVRRALDHVLPDRERLPEVRRGHRRQHRQAPGDRPRQPRAVGAEHQRPHHGARASSRAASRPRRPTTSRSCCARARCRRA